MVHFFVYFSFVWSFGLDQQVLSEVQQFCRSERTRCPYTPTHAITNQNDIRSKLRSYSLREQFDILSTLNSLTTTHSVTTPSKRHQVVAYNAKKDITKTIELLALMFDVKTLVERVLQSSPYIVQSATQLPVDDVPYVNVSNNLQLSSNLSELIESAAVVEQVDEVNVIEIKPIHPDEGEPTSVTVTRDSAGTRPPDYMKNLYEGLNVIDIQPIKVVDVDPVIVSNNEDSIKVEPIEMYGDCHEIKPTSTNTSMYHCIIYMNCF